MNNKETIREILLKVYWEGVVSNGLATTQEKFEWMDRSIDIAVESLLVNTEETK